MDVTEVKALLRLTGTQDDAYLTAVLPLIKESVRDYTGQPFIVEEGGADAFPALVKLAIAKWCQAFTNPAGVASQGMGSVSFSYDPSGGGIPSDVKKLLDQYIRGKGSFGFIPSPLRTPIVGALEDIGGD